MGRHARPTRGVLAVHEKQEANRMATASHEELPRLPSRDGKYQQKEKGVGEYKLEGRKDPWVPRDWDTRTHLKKKEHYTTTTPVNLDKWLVDSAATSHFCMEREWYDSKELPPSDALIRSKDCKSKICGVGNITFYVYSDGKFVKLILKDVLFSPNMRENLISGSKIV
ncbi:hypothetical protein AVEN_158960-1 [Araneus ventricosus]|uniref:Retrovirus-related Pol polyprotein from transposon TNT 1-94-like beta-barrel domain-containing protein n=1 Tax=Araneus ventricosus TaxID=182803 RepID=A0A4Y2B9F5_ARAVE|nr:hypothetical protein AVEN_158960-1 [Araneus ventricosus]